jgi:hypothetical protein
MADAKGKKDTEQAAAPEANQAKRLLHQQLGQVLAQLRQAATARLKKDA